jgi:integrase
MARSKKLTPLGIEAAKKEAKRTGNRIERPDGGSGLYLVAQASGAWSFAKRYRFEGKPKKLTLDGPLTLAMARKFNADADCKLEQGIDPGAEKRQAKGEARDRSADTVEHWVEKYIELRAKPKTRSWRATERLFEAHVLPAWGDRTVHSIRQSDVLDLVEGIAAGHPTTANRVFAWGRACFRWLLKRGVITVSPFANVEAPAKETPRERVLSDGELSQLWRACEGDRHEAFIKLLTLAGARKSEIAGMTWGELDEATRTWNLPGARSKNKRAHSIVLPRQAWAIIEGLPRISGDDHVLAATGDRKGYDRLMQRLRAKLNFAEPFVLHDIRRSVATGMAEIGIEPHIIEACLNHVSGHKAGIAGIYNRAQYKPKVTAALQAWADHVESLVTGEKAKVVQLGARR